MTLEEQSAKNPSDEAVGSMGSESAAAPAAVSHQACDARELRPAAERIADGVSSVANSLAATHRKSLCRAWWDQLKPVLLLLSIVVGGAFALEQYLASQYEATKARAETLLSDASDALGSSDRVLQAHAVRTLPRIGEFSTYSVPLGAHSLGRHLRAAVFGSLAEYPYFEQSWLLFRDVAVSRRERAEHVISSAILREGAAWEHRIRRGDGVPVGWVGGSLLFQAQLAGARANNLDLHGIQFGACDLLGADLSGSDCTGSGLLGALLDDAILRGTILERAFVAEASMNGADLSFANLIDAELRKVDAVNATFLQTDLTRANLAGARLDGSTFSQAVLVKTDFGGSSLKGVRFLQSDVSEARFDGADVEAADFTRAVGVSERILRDARNADKAVLPHPSLPKETQR